MSIFKILKRQGGVQLLGSYLRGGALFTAGAEFLLLGKSRTALEILRLAAQFKIKSKLAKKYKKELDQFEQRYTDELLHQAGDKIWFCWFQGLDKAPEIVIKCYESLKKNLPSKEIVLLTSENITRYVEFPDYIIDKWNKGQITNTHMTDLLRLELLIKYGGMWVDATVLCTSTEAEIPQYYFESDLFLYQNLKPGRDGNSLYISSWLMSAKTNNKLLMAVRYLCYTYWERNNQMVDYFLLHHFFSIVLDYYPEEWKKIVPCDNSAPHILLLRFFDSFDERMWTAIKEQSPFHKLSYKFTMEQIDLKNTYYDVIIRKE